MDHLNPDAVTIDEIDLVLGNGLSRRIDILRLDKIHPLISGNKWFKLKYYLGEAEAQKKNTILTFGGSYSNHIVATAAACRLKGLSSIGVIRGEKVENISHSLTSAANNGMRLFFSSRSDYKKKIIPAEVMKEFSGEDIFVINEGGYGKSGARGSATMLDRIDKKKYSYICCAVGTGTMTAGLLSIADNIKITGISVLKNYDDHTKEIAALLENPDVIKQLEVIQGYDFGGYGKYTTGLIDFMNRFFQQTGVPTDFVYTGKLMFAVKDLIEQDYFGTKHRILVIHSGGLQGNMSLEGKLVF